MSPPPAGGWRDPGAGVPRTAAAVWKGPVSGERGWGQINSHCREGAPGGCYEVRTSQGGQ